MSSEFSDYAAYLELAFAINLMFSQLDALSDMLINRAGKKNQALIEKLQANYVDASNGNVARASAKLQSKWVKFADRCVSTTKIWKRVSGFFALGIGVSLYFFSGICLTDWWQYVLIFIAPFPPCIVAALISFRSWRRSRKDKKGISSVIEYTGDSGPAPAPPES